MRWWIALPLLASCELVFPLSDRDAAVVTDVSADAASVCPAFGPPVFLQNPRTIIGGVDCGNYTVSRSAERGMAICNAVIEEGPIDSAALAVSKIVVEAGQSVSAPRLSPEGDQVFVTSKATVDSLLSIRIYQRTDETWLFADSPKVFPTAGAGTTVLASPPTRRAQSSRLVIVELFQAPTSVFQEFRDTENDGWSFVRSYGVSELAVTAMTQPALSADGLRLVFTANTGQVHYTARADLTQPFPPSFAIAIPNFAVAQYPYLTEDCARLYFTTTDTISYVDQ
ncbi:MAG: hypothetical protein ABI867_27330 [Kofleriaceae bacterium]